MTSADPWEEMRGATPHEREQLRALRAELDMELSPGHPLYGETLTILGGSTSLDDVLVGRSNGGWAAVTLTWRGWPETPPWPLTVYYDTADDLHAALEDRPPARTSGGAPPPPPRN